MIFRFIFVLILGIYRLLGMDLEELRAAHPTAPGFSAAGNLLLQPEIDKISSPTVGKNLARCVLRSLISFGTFYALTYLTCAGVTGESCNSELDKILFSAFLSLVFFPCYNYDLLEKLCKRRSGEGN